MTKTLIYAAVAILTLALFAVSGEAAEQAGPRATIDISGHPFKGPANAPVTVVVFSDYF
jgi:hypothetical protein